MRKNIKNALIFLAYSNIIISLGSVGIAYLTTSLLSLSSHISMYLVCFLVTYFVYSINRLTDIKEDMISHHSRVEFVKKRSVFFFVGGMFALVVALVLSYLNSLLTLLVVSIPVILVISYSIGILPTSIFSKKRLKEYFLIKNIVVSTGWAMIPLYVSTYTGTFNLGFIFLSIFVFLRIFIGVIMFDIRDIIGDRVYKIQTIPVVYGVKKSKEIILILNIISFFILLIPALLNLLSFYPTLFVGLFAFVMGFLYIKSKADIKFLCDVVVDGEYVLLGIISFLATLVM